MKTLLRTNTRVRETKLKPHPRQKDIDTAKPPMQTLKGVGNGTERKHGYGRGGPC